MTTEQNPNLHIPDVRLSYFYGHEPYTSDDGKINYGTHLLMKPDHLEPDVARTVPVVSTFGKKLP